MGKRIFVGNLSFSATESQLSELFSAHGEVSSVAIVKDKFTDRSRGFAFIEMADDSAANAAIAALNQHDLDGRPLTVNEARARTEGGPRGGGPGRGGPPRGGGRGERRGFTDRPRW